MAGPSSKASNLNIGIAENSSHSEIEHEVEAAKAIGESDEVCGLERKECDDIMEHLKNNLGLVVKSLGPEGQIVLHIAVMAGKTKKPELPTSKCTNKGLSEAVVDSEWYRALESLDCKALMALLKANPCLVVQTGPEGWTVLHAATFRGCLQLLDQVSDLFKDNAQFVDEMSGVKVARDDLYEAKYGTFEAEAHDMAWFTCPRDIRQILKRGDHLFYGDHLASTKGFRYNVSQHLTNKLIEIMEREPSKKAFESLEENYQQDKNYNFLLESGYERKELQFHYACRKMNRLYDEMKYVKSVIDGCLELKSSESIEILTYLFQLQNAQGRTPLHEGALCYGITKLLKLVPPGIEYKNCLNARDERGWTTLHFAAANGDHDVLDALLKDGRLDANARTYDEEDRNIDSRMEGKTALHLAILHNNVRGVESLLQCPYTDVNALLYRYIVCGYERIKASDDDYKRAQIEGKRSFWSPLQLAAIMGLSDVVRLLLQESKLGDIYDDGKLKNNSIIMGEDYRGVSALLLASASGNPSTLRLFLDNPKFNPLVKFEGATALHYATNAMIPHAKKREILFHDPMVGPFVWFNDCGIFPFDNSRVKQDEEALENEPLTPTLYLGRQACITMLLQAGVDIWEIDNDKRFAEPGPQASQEALLWWHDKIAQETLEAKKSLNDAANAISVVAALVATASFVGPLQPPLGYGGDSVEGGIQDTHSSIRVFMVSNILSFYLAIASIMFAVVPSLPMPQEGIYVEWQRMRRTVGVAMFFLLMSVLGVLISFGAASNSVVSEDYSWRHVGLSFYPTLVGGIICILGIGLFFLRLLRLVFNRNAGIRSLYTTFVKF